MIKHDRYQTSHLVEVQFEPGSGKRVLKNLSGIKRKREMDTVEQDAQIKALEVLIDTYDKGSRFTAGDICKIHKIWLGNIYEWAGHYRNVNISKGNFHFAASAQVPKLMREFDKDFLRQYTPCNYVLIQKIAKALAVVHTELVLIHSFREGNGRTARLLADLMATQAGLPPLDYGGIIRKKKEYFTAIQAGLDKDYTLMEKMFLSVIRRTLRIRGQRR